MMHVHLTFVQGFAIVWVLFSLVMIVVGVRLGLKSVQQPRHIREEVASFDAEYQMLYDEVMEELQAVLKGEKK